MPNRTGSHPDLLDGNPDGLGRLSTDCPRSHTHMQQVATGLGAEFRKGLSC